MSDRLFDALEVCLQKLEQGQTIDSVLKLYPDLESELRPILKASLQARTLADSSVPSLVQRRGRTRLLKYATELRKSEPTSSKKRVISFFPRMALALGLTAVLILGSTGLVGASSSSLPGDQLYPVKRTWEGVQLALVFNQQGREVLQSQFDQERLNEIDELLVKSRTQPVTFSGLVTKQQDGAWLVSGIRVLVTNKTRLSSSQISDSFPVMVIGITRSDGVLEADEIRSLQPGSMLPPLEPSEGGNNNSVPNVVPTVPPVAVQTPSAPTATPQSFAFTGIVQKEEGATWTINGQAVSMDRSKVTGSINVGDAVKFEGFYGDNGNFVVTSIQSDSQGNPSRSSGGNDSNNGHDNNGGDNGGDSNGGNGNGSGGKGGGDGSGH